MTAALKGVVWSDVGAAIVDGICSIKWTDLLLSFGDLFEELSYSLAELLIGILDEVFGTHLIDKWNEFEAESRARSKESKEAFLAPDYTPSDDLQENLETLAEMVNNADATTKELNTMVRAIVKGGGTAEQIEEALSKIENQDAVKRFSELYIEPMKNGLLVSQEATEKPVCHRCCLRLKEVATARFRDCLFLFTSILYCRHDIISRWNVAQKYCRHVMQYCVLTAVYFL